MRLILVLLIAVAFGLSGCKKSGASNSANAGGQSGTMVKSYELIITDSILTGTSSDYLYTYSYDNNNRQTAATQTGTDTYKGVVTNIDFSAQFTYAQGTQTETGTLHRGSTTYNSTAIYYLNSSGYPNKTVVASMAGAISSVTTSLYTYDANGYCTVIDNSSTYNNIVQPATKTLFTISGGNVVREDNYWATGSLISSAAYTFGNTVNKTDQRFSTPPNAGHLNTNLVLSSYTNSLGVPKSALSYSYSFDSLGRVSGAKATTSSGKIYMQYNNIQYLN